MPIYLSKHPILKWTPAVLMMVAIFLFSARPSTDLPHHWWEGIFYKGGHVIGYAMLTTSFWRAFEFRMDRRRMAWLLAILYAITDEYHQSFVPGRHPSAFDVVVYDNVGALLSLWIAGRVIKQKQPSPDGLVVEQETIPANN